MCPLLSVDTSIESFDFCVYQRPVTRPLLECQSLELPCNPGLEGVSSTRCSVFPLPDVSPRVFTCGITSFRDTISKILSSCQLSTLGYANRPSMALSVITMTNAGDLYNSVLLERSDREMTQTVNLGGRNYISVGAQTDDGEPTRKSFVKRPEGGFKLRTDLCDVPPTPNSKVTKTIVETRSDCEPFISIPLQEIRQRCVGSMPLQERHSAKSEDTDHTAIQQPIQSSLITGITVSTSDQLSDAVDDLRSSTRGVASRSEEGSYQGLAALGSQLWTQSSRNT